uniref:Uncharacterized protein n=1 Tax=Anguilla anguilla TaxID=7936 RepID=A0A0E9T132_ANGAN
MLGQALTDYQAHCTSKQFLF